MNREQAHKEKLSMKNITYPVLKMMAAQADLDASREDYRDVMVSLLAEVALNYVEVRTIQTRLTVAETNLKTQNETYELTGFRFEAGLTTALDKEQAKYNLENTRSQIPTLRIGLEEAKNRLAVLLGIRPGAIRKNIEVQNALQEQALIQYEASILTALEDVENGLTAYAEEQSRRQSLKNATQAAQQAVDLALNQYASGTIDFQDVLEAQRSLLSFQAQLAESEGAVTSDLIRLYKALGGGWESMMSKKTESNGKKEI
jgi:outer membrane protein TolC